LLNETIGAFDGVCPRTDRLRVRAETRLIHFPTHPCARNVRVSVICLTEKETFRQFHFRSEIQRTEK